MCIINKLIWYLCSKNIVWPFWNVLFLSQCVRNIEGYWCMIFQVVYLTSRYMCWECSETAYCVSLHSVGANQISDSGCITLCNVLQKCTELQVLKWVWSNLLWIVPHPHTQSAVLSCYICMVLWGSILFLILNLHRFSDSSTCQTKLYFWVDKLCISLSYILKHFGKCVPFWA